MTDQEENLANAQAVPLARYMASHPELVPVMALERRATRMVWIATGAVIVAAFFGHLDMMLLRLAGAVCVLVPAILLFALRGHIRAALAGLGAAIVARETSG